MLIFCFQELKDEKEEDRGMEKTRELVHTFPRDIKREYK